MFVFPLYSYYKSNLKSTYEENIARTDYKRRAEQMNISVHHDDKKKQSGNPFTYVDKKKQSGNPLMYVSLRILQILMFDSWSDSFFICKKK